eukprot:TRINITY_DN24850_c0_g1_i1.p1 TRINITY_DN24850_c0_g1~~TRINITY_DN24850_c0_g1_i1.p1  ORF type:complete len:337 (+),score=33.94 TRINITY_DN24850_c0_g1_i1:185-1195(+)
MDTADAPVRVPCRLLAGPTALYVQALLALLVICSLAYKRHAERPQRPVSVWGMDVSKQAVSSGAAHVTGIVVAMLVQSRTKSAWTSECSWYFVVFTVDTTLGVMLALMMHRFCVRTANAIIAHRTRWRDSFADTGARRERSCVSDVLLCAFGSARATAAGSRASAIAVPAFEQPVTPASDEGATVWDDLAACGNYGNPPDVRRWAVQLFEFTICVVLARVICGVLIICGGAPLSVVAAALDRAFQGHPDVLLLFVMVCCPMAMNMLQAYIQDQWLKFRGRQGCACDSVPADEGLLMQDSNADSTSGVIEGGARTPTARGSKGSNVQLLSQQAMQLM